MGLYISTDTPESTDDLLELLSPRTTVEKIRKILNNRRSHTDQIRAIKKLVSTTPPNHPKSTKE